MIFYCASKCVSGYGLEKDLDWNVREYSKNEEKILRESESHMTNKVYAFYITDSIANAMNMKEDVLYSYHFHKTLSKDENVIWQLYQDEKKGTISQEGRLYLAYARAGYYTSVDKEKFYQHIKDFNLGSTGRYAWTGFYQGRYSLNYSFRGL